MILVDYSQIVIANVMTNPKDMSIDFIRHLVLNTIRMYNQKFKEDYGDLVICCDGSDNWRRGYYEYYKANRKTTREKSEFDWNELFRILHIIRRELDEYFPYKVLHLDGAEADDIISALTIYTSENKVLNGVFEEPESILILSSDKDFQQLQKYENVKQYSPLKKKFIKTSNPIHFLKEHIMRGDASDGIPNFLSEDDVFVSENKRQKPLSSKKLSVWLELDPEEFCEGEMLRNYRRNEMLIDLTKIPTNLYNQIIDVYVNTKDVGRSKIFNYFVKNRLKNLMENLNEF